MIEGACVDFQRVFDSPFEVTEQHKKYLPFSLQFARNWTPNQIYGRHRESVVPAQKGNRLVRWMKMSRALTPSFLSCSFFVGEMDSAHSFEISTLSFSSLNASTRSSFSFLSRSSPTKHQKRNERKPSRLDVRNPIPPTTLPSDTAAPTRPVQITT